MHTPAYLCPLHEFPFEKWPFLYLNFQAQESVLHNVQALKILTANNLPFFEAHNYPENKM